ncbi:cache domain-containing sensor histidine kinase [Metabacillus endolithicus]|uniref:Sensor histidine kinase n=1 Tax=Metabacillus endolithicus TaxID=1535204 RepID=A0ABW5C389_9BACI|nr:sensor histidine kinase [Metabacillus endolithicus]UPG62662.1 sensor histidine kinase [Metabacillus endolithicus]
MKEALRRILYLLRPRKIRNKYFLFMIMLSIPPLFILGFISFNIAKNTLVDKQVQSTQEHLRTSSEVADLLFDNIIKMERLISWNDGIRQALIDSSEVGGNREIDDETGERMNNLISSYLIDTQDIDSICLFDKDFHSVCYGNSDSYGALEQNGTHQYISLTEWYQKSVEAKGKPVFNSYNVLTNDLQTFSSVKLLKDPQGIFEEEVTGLLVVNVKKSMFSKVFNENDESNFVVLDSDGYSIRPIYTYPQSFSGRIRTNQDKESLINELENDQYIVNSYKNKTTGWSLMLLIEEDNLLKESNQIGRITAIIALIIAIIALYLSFILSGRITRPLRQLKKMVIGGAKELYNDVELTDKDEIGTISETFNRLNVRTKELNEKLVRSELKEREAELRALQAQIKPHFLYNTLDSIYWMATLQNNPEIAKMAFSLSKSFKLSLNSGEELIPVSKELEHIEHYMTIQNLRYNGRFEYIEQVDKELMDVEILKLLIQPLVENAIYHGLEPKEGKGTITVKGRFQDNLIIFNVEDDGVGIDKLKKVDQGYGLRNVRERLTLFYGPSSKLLVTSEVKKGTKVELRFFLRKEE